jgi:hypothetical protein
MSLILVSGATYYEVDIDNTIIEPNGQYIVNDCYYTLNRARVHSVIELVARQI